MDQPNYEAPLIALVVAGFGVMSSAAFALGERTAGIIFIVLFLVSVFLALARWIWVSSRAPGPEGQIPAGGADMPGQEMTLGMQGRDDYERV
jgi:hypothetical protein